MMDFIYEYKRYFITTVIGVILAAVISFSNGILSAESTAAILAILSDACFVPGVIILGLGIIMLVANEGLFNGVAYGLKTLGRTFSAKKDEKIKDEEFHEYNVRLNKKQSKVSHMIIVGLVFIVLSVIFAVLYGI